MKSLLNLLMFVICAVATIHAASPSFTDFDKRAKKGDKLTVAFLGGSLTWGARASDPLKTSYRALVGKYLQKKYPNARFTFIDAAIGGTGAQLGSYRLERDVLAYKPDLMFLDFTLNDGMYRTTPDTLAAHEGIIRRVITQAKCPVIQMLLADKKMVTDGTTEKMERYKAHHKIAKAYNLPCGDAIALMQKKYKAGEIKLDEIWLPESFDTCHPGDKGYKLYAEAAWNAFNSAINTGATCTVPQKMINKSTYMKVLRKKISSLKPLPHGWRVTTPSTNYCAFDFLMTRWLDDLTVASNFIPVTRKKNKTIEPAKPLKLKFNGSSVLFFGQSAPRSGKVIVNIDGKEKTYNTRQLGTHNTGRMWLSIAERLEDTTHTMIITPVFEKEDEPVEICLESICIAGSNPTLSVDSAAK